MGVRMIKSMASNAWLSICSIALNIEARLVQCLGTRPCLLCDRTIDPPAISFKPVYQSRFLCQDCIGALRPVAPIAVTLNLNHESDSQVNCISICPYEGMTRQAIRAFKYQDKQELAGDLARALEGGIASLLQSSNEQRDVVLIAVPLHQTKLDERGFNQSELITNELSRRTGIKCDTKSLVRCKATSPQYGLTKTERAINVSHAFSANHRVKGKHTILVDDVLTSGATALACAEALLAAGAERVSVLTIARALLRSEQNGSSELPKRSSELGLELSLEISREPIS